MNARHPLISAVALAISILLAMPLDVAAQAQATQQAAGKITAMLPVVNVVRGPQQVPASTNQPVFWGDTVNTGHLARARVNLTDGSILSVGSDSNLTIVKHDASAQQTDLDLNYGKVRAQAVKLVKPDAHFKVRTPVGVAGVVGTVMIVSFDTLGNMNVICEEGTCQACDLAGNCVTLHGGQESNVHGNSAPTQPVPTTPVNMTAALNSTSVSGAAGAAGGGISAGVAVGVGIGAAAAAVVATVVIRAVNKTSTCSTNTSTPTSAAYPAASCKGISTAGAGKQPGQRP
jgi:hypothetical protein